MSHHVVPIALRLQQRKKVHKPLLERQTDAARLDLQSMYEHQAWPRAGGIGVRNASIQFLIRECASHEPRVGADTEQCDIWKLVQAREGLWRAVFMLALSMYDRFVEMYHSTEPPPEDAAGLRVWLNGVCMGCLHFANMHVRTATADSATCASFQVLVYETLMCNVDPARPAHAPTMTDLDLVQLMARSKHPTASNGATTEIVEYVVMFMRFWAEPTLLAPVDLVDLAWDICGSAAPLSRGGMVRALCELRDSMPELYAFARGECDPPEKGILQKLWCYKLEYVRMHAENTAVAPLGAGDLQGLHHALAAAFRKHPPTP
jgi:hypothetical protein